MNNRTLWAASTVFFFGIGIAGIPKVMATEQAVNPGAANVRPVTRDRGDSGTIRAPHAVLQELRLLRRSLSDPFIPLNGDMRNDQEALDRPPQIASMALKGIVQDAKGRMALLTSGMNSYILKAKAPTGA